ncbi:MAG: PDZ domain-containing protein [Planctomycetota bacterium]|nr:MAG: PDZ domain-containing protein [Planctomycetota bacterium]
MESLKTFFQKGFQEEMFVSRQEQEKAVKMRYFFVSLAVYTFCVVVLAVFATLLWAPDIFGAKVEYLSYSELQKMLKDLPPSSKRIVAVSKYILPTVVNVTTFKREQGSFGFGGFEFFHRPRIYRSSGSGFILDKEGHIATNHHVVGGAQDVYITFLNKKTVKARVVGADPETDIALLRIENPHTLAILRRRGILQVAQLGNSSDLHVGEYVLAVGNPFALDHSVSLGIVSAKGRSNMGVIRAQDAYENFIQTDAAINPGNSGGPLVRVATGRVVGMNTAILSKSGGFQGIGLAIPIDMAKKVIAQLRKNGKVQRAYLGISIVNLTPEMAQELGLDIEQGVRITEVIPDGPADLAGLRPNDVIVAVDGKPVENVSQLRTLVALNTIGSKIHLTVRRGKEKLEVEVLLDSKENILRRLYQNVDLGVELRPLSEEEVQQYGAEGLLITKVRKNSLAAANHLREGWLILGVNGRRTTTIREFQKAIAPIKRGKRVLLHILTEYGVQYTLQIP